MVTVRHLYGLQELDMEIAEHRSRIASIDGELGDRSDLDSLNQEIENKRQGLQDIRLEHKSRTLDADSMREKVQDVEGKLYSGSITSPRELAGFEKESSILRAQLQKLDDRLLEIMLALEEAQTDIQSLEAGSRQAKKWLRARHAELADGREQLEVALADLEARRGGLTSHVGQHELKLYEDLRISKGGLAIAKVERGLCRGCRMALPTHQLQRARLGREPVLCNSCGRILYVS